MFLPLLTVLLFAPAEAAPTATPPTSTESDVSALATEAQEAFDAGDYDRVVDVAQRAYALSGSLAFLYAQAHAERFRGNCREALGLYGRVLAADPSGPYAEVARKGITICEAQPDPEPDPVPPPAPIPEPEPKPESNPEPVEDTSPVRPRPDALGVGLVSAGAVSAVASIALFASGGVAAGQADTTDDEQTFVDARDRARNLLIAGGAVAGAAVVFSTLGAVRLVRKRREQVQVHLSGAYVGLSLRSRF